VHSEGLAEREEREREEIFSRKLSVPERAYAELEV